MATSEELNIVIPAKDPRGAKERLADILSPDQRETIALVLLEQTLALFKGLSRAYNVLVVTDSGVVEKKARDLSVSVLVEDVASGETAAVEKATAWSVANGFASQCVVPADMGCVDPADIASLLNQPRPNPSVILCPATGDDGTNAILTTPPDVMAFRFGERSFPDYQARADQQNVPCAILRLPSLVLDLDTPDDLRTFLERHHDQPAAELLRQWNVHRKL